MLNPAIGRLIKKCDSRYELVLEVAKLARIIAKEHEDSIDPAFEKSVSLAIDEIDAGLNPQA